MTQDPYRYFRIEARELLEQLGQGVLDLEKETPRPELLARLLRLAHTLKGAARVVKQPEIADRAHTVEDALAPFRDAGSPIPRDRIDVILTSLDDIGKRIGALAPAEHAEAPAPPRLQPDVPFRSVRTDIGEMDRLLDGLTEAHAQVGLVQRSLTGMDQARHLVGLIDEQIAAPAPQGTTRVRPGVSGEKMRSMVVELREVFDSLDRGLANGIEQINRELQQVRDKAERLRLVPAGALFTALERAARDVARAQGKRVSFEARGSDVRLDAHVLEIIQSALLQLIRNAVAHGIEPESERTAAGKSPQGRLVVEVARQGRRAVFSCRDDGRGVDLEAVKKVVQRRGWPSVDVEKLGRKELVRLLLQGGITTSGAVTEMSGRGVGLDVVREAAERLGGAVTAQTEAGRGTTIELVVPLSLASLEALLAEAAGLEVVLPLDAVRGAVRVPSNGVTRTGPTESVLHEGKLIPFLPLACVLSEAAPPARGGQLWSVVIVEGDTGTAAVGVDRLSGTASVVLRPLPDLAPASGIVAGVSLDAEGNPRLVLDPDGLVAEATRGRAAQLEQESALPPVLVIDDSLTTRMLEQSILESAGYEVDLATSGEEALEKARAQRYALFLVDIEMPGMDGFTFIERTRADPALQNIPSILVTSRASADDQQRGHEVGAQAYIVKNEFDQRELLERIRSLVGSR